ncbi:MAG: hypothetical protein JWR10_2560, partial [Rubritepida sp.]|nr:hypothetical protein [Rubritepida sp.]
HVAGRDAAEFRERDEYGVLETLADPTREHAFCVVQGEPGSGKSHLIRWIAVNWPVPTDIKLLLRRADGSLEGALSQLRDRLPSEFAPLFDNLGQRQKASSRGRANIFLSTLANTLEPGHFDKEQPDEDWCKRLAPAELLAHLSIKERWKAPSRILNLLEGAGGGRNSATASFDLFDIQELADLCPALRGQASIVSCQELVRRLERESNSIRNYRDQEWLADELASEHEDQFPTSIALIRALNLRRNDAIQNVLGVSAQGLKTLFRQVREALAERGQRLVLLLEDITSWEGLDDSLIDVLVFNAAARGEDDEKPICPLISVVGVTPAYYDKLQSNYRQRITHEVQLGQAIDGLQDVATLRGSETRRQFAVRYLSAVRAGPALLNEWFKKVRSGSDVSPPNLCEACPRQDKCFAVFGDVSGIGLFPFTEHAFDRFFEALKENDNGQTWKTPRGILQAILNPNLVQPESLGAGTYPTSFIEPDAFRADRRSDLALVPRLEQIVNNRIDAPAERSRMRRMLAYWANPNRADTENVAGDLTFAGASQSIFEAFGLPWIGGDATNTPAAPSGPVILPQPIITPAPTEEVEEPDPVAKLQLGSFARPARPAVRAPKPKRLMPNKNELEQLREEIRTWSTSGKIENSAKWNEILYLIVEQIDLRAIHVTPPLFKKVLTKEMVKLEGTTTRHLNYFVLPTELWVRNGLEAFVSLRQDTEMTLADAEYNRRNLTAMMRRLQRSVASFIDSKVPKLADGGRWAPVKTFAQILLARAYLRGAARADAPLVDQMRAVLSDEGLSETDFSARSMPWQEWLNATKGFHERLRLELRAMVSLRLGDAKEGMGGGSALVDASDLATAIVQFNESGKFDPIPEESAGLPELYRKARELAQHWTEKCFQIERVEHEQITGRSQSVSSLLRGRDIVTHVARLDTCISGIVGQLPSVAIAKVQNWKQTFVRLSPKLDEGAGARIEELILALEDEVLPVKLLPRLTWLAHQPVRDLQDVLTTLQAGERAVEELRDHARDCVWEAGTGSLEDVHAVGRAIRLAVIDFELEE